MPRRLRWARAFVMLSGLLSCTVPNPNVRVRRLADGRLEVDGPLSGPFKKLEELAQSACELMTSQPGASNGLQGFEYCALHYFSATDDAFFLSYLSDLGSSSASGKKSCILPQALRDPGHPDAVILGGDHNHPHNPRFSRIDLRAESNWPPLRFADPTTKRIWNRQLLLFYREKTGACRSYAYDQATRIVSALRAGEWVAIGKVYNDQGDVELLGGMDWSP